MTIPISPKDVLISRISPNTPRTDHLRGIVGNIFGLRERLVNESARLNADRNISDIGRRSKEAELAKSLTKNLSELTQPLRRAKAEFAAKRATFRQPEVDKTDGVSESKRQEIRTFIRSLPLPEKMPALEGLGDAGTLAILDAPALLSGLPPDRYEHIKSAYLERQFGPQMQELESIEDDYVCVESAQMMVRRDLQKVSGLGDNDFAALEKSFEN